MVKGVFVFAYTPDGSWLAQLRSKYVSNPLMWCFPGGGVEPGESLLDGTRREFFEEVGVTPPADELQYVNTIDGRALFTWEVTRPFEGARNREVALHAWLPLGYQPSDSCPWMSGLYQAAWATL